MALELHSSFPENLRALNQRGEVVEVFTKGTGEWRIVFSYPADFTPICSSEIIEFARLSTEFHRRNCKVLGISMDTSDTHKEWIHHLESLSKESISFDLLSDESGRLLDQLKLRAVHRGRNQDPTKQYTASVYRGLYIVSPGGEVLYTQMVANTVGRNISEILRIVDSLQLSALENGLGTSADWTPGKDPIDLRHIRHPATEEEPRQRAPSLKFSRLSDASSD